MNYIEMYYMVEQVRNLIYFFNLQYDKNRMQTGVEELLSNIQKIDELAASDMSVCSGSMINDSDIILKYVKSQDFTAIYDVLNGELFRNLKKIANDLYNQYALELTDYFWSKNKEALRIRYPKILKEMENLQEENDFVRSYGLRGKVVYRREGDMEYDLYSAYHPFEAGRRMTEESLFERYDKIYIWGCNGGFEIDGILHGSESNCLNVEVYVTDLKEFKHILMCTKRDGGILDPAIHWNFHVKAEDFFKRFPLKEKEEIYLYVSRYCKKERVAFEKFAARHLICSNIGG